MPVVGFMFGGAADASAAYAAAFRKGLSDTGNIEGQNVFVEYHWLEGRYDRAPTLVADMARRRVAVIASLGATPLALAAKAVTTTIPIVFSVPDDPVQLGLVASLARPGGNMTGVNYFTQEITAKRLALLHELVPKAARIAVLVNPANPASAERTLNEVQAAARALSLQIPIFNASTSDEIDEAFAAIAREHCDALFVGGDGLFNGRRVQFAIMAARERLPASYSVRDYVQAGGLTSYGADIADAFRQVGTYTGSIINGAKPESFRCCNRLSSSSSSTSTRPKHSVSMFRRRCSPAPTR
jgi:putative ABC transport system substrate-binding protein